MIRDVSDPELTEGPLKGWLAPTPEMLDDPVFCAIWGVIKSWDVNVPGLYSGYMGCTGNHARAILEAAKAAQAT